MKRIFTLILALTLLISISTMGARAYNDQAPIFYQTGWAVFDAGSLSTGLTGYTSYTYDSTTGEFHVSGNPITLREGEAGVVFESTRVDYVHQIVIFRDGSWVRYSCMTNSVY